MPGSDGSSVRAPGGRVRTHPIVLCAFALSAFVPVILAGRPSESGTEAPHRLSRVSAGALEPAPSDDAVVSGRERHAARLLHRRRFRTELVRAAIAASTGAPPGPTAAGGVAAGARFVPGAEAPPIGPARAPPGKNRDASTSGPP